MISRRSVLRLAYRTADWAAYRGMTGWYGLFRPLPGSGRTLGYRFRSWLTVNHPLPWNER